jgi:hypothetical protein
MRGRALPLLIMGHLTLGHLTLVVEHIYAAMVVAGLVVLLYRDAHQVGLKASSHYCAGKPRGGSC